MVSRIFSAYGRAARIRSCVRFSLAAATMFIALVIFWVFLTESIFRLTDWRLGITVISPVHQEPEAEVKDERYHCVRGASSLKRTLWIMSAAVRWADAARIRSQLNRCVPPLDRRNGAIIAEDVGCRRIEQKMLPRLRREGEPASDEDPEDVTVSE